MSLVKEKFDLSSLLPPTEIVELPVAKIPEQPKDQLLEDLQELKQRIKPRTWIKGSWGNANGRRFCLGGHMSKVLQKDADPTSIVIFTTDRAVKLRNAIQAQALRLYPFRLASEGFQIPEFNDDNNTSLKDVHNVIDAAIANRMEELTLVQASKVSS